MGFDPIYGISIQESDFSMQWATLNLFFFKKKHVSIFKGQNTIYICKYTPYDHAKHKPSNGKNCEKS